LYKNGVAESFSVHGLVMLAFVGPRPDNLEVLHFDGNKLNNRLDNLRYGTSSENKFEAVRQGLNFNANKTHCINGHEFTPDNTYDHGGNRGCKTCHREQCREARRRYRERNPWVPSAELSPADLEIRRSEGREKMRRYRARQRQQPPQSQSAAPS